MGVVDYINIEVLNPTLLVDDSIFTTTQPIFKGVFLMLYYYYL